MTPAIVLPENASALSIRIDDDVSVTGEDAKKFEAAWKRELPEALRGRLGEAGFRLVARGTASDLVAVIRAKNVWVTGLGGNVGAAATLRLTSESDHSLVASAEWHVPGSSAPDAVPDLAATALVDQIIRSQRLLQFARSKQSDSQHSAPASAAAPGQAPSVAAALAPTAPPAPTASSPPAPAATHLKSGPMRGNAYALVIGIEKYRDAPAPIGARADAQHFAELAKTTLGVPADHVHVAVDDRATKTDVERELAWLTTNVAAGGRVYFFFAGHGAPDAAHGTPYLLPYDGDPKYISTSGIQLSTVLDSLGKTKAQDVVAFVDACFSGAGGRSVLPPGARPLVRVKQPTTTTSPRVALLSSAGASEISGPTKDGGEGLFTHMLIEAIGTGAADIDGDGNVSLAEVETWIKPRVAREAKQDNREQTPALTAGSALGDPATVILASGLAK